MRDCPPGALRRHPDGEIYIDDTCIGCGNCAAFCSYGVIQMTHLPGPRPPSLWRAILFGARPRLRHDASRDHEIAVKCDLCRELPGRTRAVACVAACPTGAIARVSPEQLLRQITLAARNRGLGWEEIRGAAGAGTDPAVRHSPPPVSDEVAAVLARLQQLPPDPETEELAQHLRRVAALLSHHAGLPD